MAYKNNENNKNNKNHVNKIKYTKIKLKTSMIVYGSVAAAANGPCARYAVVREITTKTQSANKIICMHNESDR